VKPHPVLGGLPLVLGGNVFDWTAKGDAGFAVLDAFYEAGGRMIDTADVYSAWVPGHKGGESEALIGRWLESRGVRAEMLIHTKTGMLGGKELYEPARVLQSLDASLERLRTDYIDLYYAHQDFEELPIGEIVAAFDGAVRTGKVRALGASKFSAVRLAAALDAAKAQDATPFTVLQNWYNLIERDHFGPDLQALCAGHGMTMLPFFGLANGFLTGKYRNVADLTKSTRGPRVAALLTSAAPMLAAMDEVSAETGASLARIALAWLRVQPGIGAPIASATSAAQVVELCASARLELSPDQLARLSTAG
jgi:aryl-alcohol dehydrogenase-like predicted oxidoreductase